MTNSSTARVLTYTHHRCRRSVIKTHLSHLQVDTATQFGQLRGRFLQTMINSLRSATTPAPSQPKIDGKTGARSKKPSRVSSPGVSKKVSDGSKRKRVDDNGDSDRDQDDDRGSDVEDRRKPQAKKTRIIKDPIPKAKSPTIVVTKAEVGMELFAVQALIEILRDKGIYVSQEARWFREVETTKQSESDLSAWTKSELCSGKAKLPKGAAVGKCSIFAVPKSFMEDKLEAMLREFCAKGPSKSLILVLGFDQEKKENSAIVGYPWKDKLYYYDGLKAETAYSIACSLQDTESDNPWQLSLSGISLEA